MFLFKPGHTASHPTRLFLIDNNRSISALTLLYNSMMKFPIFEVRWLDRCCRSVISVLSTFREVHPPDLHVFLRYTSLSFLVFSVVMSFILCHPCRPIILIFHLLCFVPLRHFLSVPPTSLSLSHENSQRPSPSSYFTYPVLSLLLNDSLLSSLASYFSFIRLPPITFIFLFISSHFTSCFLCEVSAISTQLTSGASSPLLSSILLLDMKRDTSATTMTAGRSMRRRQLKAGRRAASNQCNRKKYSYCVDR